MDKKILKWNFIFQYGWVLTNIFNSILLLPLYLKNIDANTLGIWLATGAVPTAAGVVVIKASQAGNADYNPAPEVLQQLNVSPSTQCTATGSILRELWSGVGGNDIWQIPLSNTPSTTSQLSSFEGPIDAGNNYGSRIRGYICAPLTGNYTFWIAGDDATELWLSTDDNTSNKVKIAYSLSWTNHREWTKFSTQKSVTIRLEAGKRYYIEALQKEGAGGDHLSVAWQMPDGVFEGPIAGSRLSPFQISGQMQAAGSISLQQDMLSGTVSSALKAFPNPFFQQTVIEVTAPETGIASVDVYDAWGRNISRLFSGKVVKGVTQRFTLDGLKLSSGIYFIRFTSLGGVINYKIVRGQ